jgi:hypothetical protein
LVEYLRTPKLMGLARQEAQRTLRFIIGYRLLRDLRRGWRFNNPNLDQLNLLDIAIAGLDEFCADDQRLCRKHSTYLPPSPAQSRRALSECCSTACAAILCLESRYLDPVEQDKAAPAPTTYLNERWAFAPDENLKPAAT